MRWLGRAFTCLYLVVPAALAITGNEHEYAGWYVAALVWTLPCGIVGFIGIYVAYALVKGVGGLFAATTTANGADAAWLATSLDVIRIGAFVLAAAVNVLLFDYWLRRALRRSGDAQVRRTPRSPHVGSRRSRR
jgi:hypothetical protein